MSHIDDSPFNPSEWGRRVAANVGLELSDEETYVDSKLGEETHLFSRIVFLQIE
jgi:hypothetical protein